MQPLPRISVIIPCFRAEATLSRALESVVAQSYPDLELIVLDGGSTDGTVEIIKRFLPHITYWRSQKDDGPNACYNEGIARATGDIIALLNADDAYEPGALCAVGEAFAADPELDGVTLEAQVVERDANGALQVIKRFTGDRLALSATASPVPNARFWRKSVYVRFGDFLVTNHLGQRYVASDLEFLLRIARAPLKHRVLPVMGYTYLAHAGSLTFGGNPRVERQMFEERAHMAAEYLAQGNWDAASRRRLRRWVRRGTTRQALWLAREGKWREALAVAQKGIQTSPFTWPLDLLRLLLNRP